MLSSPQSGLRPRSCSAYAVGAFLLLKCSQALEKEKKMWYNYGDGNVAVKIIRLHS